MANWRVRKFLLLPLCLFVLIILIHLKSIPSFLGSDSILEKGSDSSLQHQNVYSNSWVGDAHSQEALGQPPTQFRGMLLRRVRIVYFIERHDCRTESLPKNSSYITTWSGAGFSKCLYDCCIACDSSTCDSEPVHELCE
jgi:hypothetical protein